jgi:hypothetical protein
MSITPVSKDKRFMLTVGTLAAVLLLHTYGKTPNGELLTFIAAAIGGYIGQSQWGQTKRTLSANKDMP